MDQCSRLKRLARRFAGHLGRRQPAQLLVHEREQLLGGLGVAPASGFEENGDFAHLVSVLASGPASISARASLIRAWAIIQSSQSFPKLPVSTPGKFST